MNTDKLKNHRGRFVTVTVKRSTGTTSYCAKILKVTPKSLKFSSVNEKNKTVTIPLANVVSVS